MSLGMDYEDFLDESEKEIRSIAEDLSKIPDSCIGLINCLTRIAIDNEDMEYWKERQSES